MYSEFSYSYNVEILNTMWVNIGFLVIYLPRHVGFGSGGGWKHGAPCWWVNTRWWVDTGAVVGLHGPSLAFWVRNRPVGTSSGKVSVNQMKTYLGRETFRVSSP
jgi:hypothetical protein